MSLTSRLIRRASVGTLQSVARRIRQRAVYAILTTEVLAHTTCDDSHVYELADQVSTRAACGSRTIAEGITELHVSVHQPEDLHPGEGKDQPDVEQLAMLQGATLAVQLTAPQLPRGFSVRRQP